MSEQWLVELPEGFTLVPFEMGIPGMVSYRISDTEAHLGILSANAVVKVARYTPPIVTPPDTPPPAPVVVYYECKITKLNIRLEPDSGSADKGDIFKGEKVGIVAVVTEGDETWGRLESGYYAAIKIGANVYLERVTTGG